MSGGYTDAVTELVQGTVIAMHGPLVRVQVGDRTLVVASRRRLKWEGRPQAAALVVGDDVEVEMDDGEGVIVAVHPRRTCLLRRAPGSKRPQVLAANVDQALVVFAARQPEPKPALVDRFLVACHLAGIEPILTINKVDQGIEQVEPWLACYVALGYPVLRVSCRTARGLGELKRRLPGRTTLFCGPSGVGKSSLLNAIYPGFRLKVGSLSDATGKGRHTTSRAELMPLPYGGFVVDTPGLKEFGLHDTTRAEIEAAFPELSRHAVACRFTDCSHDHEPGCAVRAAVDAGEVLGDRLRSFHSMLGDIAEV